MALSSSGQVYTWCSESRSSTGTLRPVTCPETQDITVPTLVSNLNGVVDISCGGSASTGDCFYLACTSAGVVFSWGDGDYGKLGRGGSDGSTTPRQVDRLHDLEVVKIRCGGQFSVALCSNGAVYSWGKGDHHRLGHGSDEHVRHPKVIEELLGRRITNISLGISHAVACTDTNDVYAWGLNDHGQLGEQNDPVITAPQMISPKLKQQQSPIAGLCCGPNQTFVWTAGSVTTLESKIPFVLDVCEETFRLLDQLLDEVWEGGLDGGGGGGGYRPPKQEEECVAVAALNLLKLQLHAILSRKDSVPQFLSQGTALLTSLKRKVVELASNVGILETIQRSAQQCLQVGWSVLIPTAEERARALSTLLPNSAADASQAVSPGRRFMTDLLVSSLMADGGLEAALLAAIKVEVSDLEEFCEKEGDRDKPSSDDLLMTEQAQLEAETKRAQEVACYRKGGRKSSVIPLLHLAKQLLKNVSAQTTTQLAEQTAPSVGLAATSTESDFMSDCSDEGLDGDSAGDSKRTTEMLPNLNLLLRFQRLLFCQLYPPEEEDEISDYERDLPGALSLLKKYIQMLSQHVLEVLPQATEMGSQSQRLFYVASTILEASDPVGVLLPEFVLCLSLVHLESRQLLTQIQMTPLTMWLHSLDAFNRLAPGTDKEDADDMLWPGRNKYGHGGGGSGEGVAGIGKSKHAEEQDVNWIRRADLENHNKDGGCWVVIKGKVYDVQDFRARSHNAAAGATTDVFGDLTSGEQQVSGGGEASFHHSDQAQEMLRSFLVGSYLEPDSDNMAMSEASCPFPDLPNYSSPFMDLERNLALFLGQYNNALLQSTPLQPTEVSCARWTESKILKGGLKTIIVRDPFDETKGEAPQISTPSQPPTPLTASTSETAATTATSVVAAAAAASGADGSAPTQVSASSAEAVDVSNDTDGAALIRDLADGNFADQHLKVLLSLSARLYREQHLTFQMNFPPDHPVEEAGRVLFALLLKYQGLESYLSKVIDSEIERDGNPAVSGGGGKSSPKPLIDTLKAVHNAKWKLIRMRQESGKF
jgi:E3 ubiquitin-protein ligase HERC2